MSKKITLCFFVMLMIGQNGIYTASDRTLLNEAPYFRNAVSTGYKKACLRMLNQPEIVAQVDFNLVDWYTHCNLWYEVICQGDYFEDVALKILELRTKNNELVVDINYQHQPFKVTSLIKAILSFQPRLILKILELKKSDGALLVNINSKDDEGGSALQYMINKWYVETTPHSRMAFGIPYIDLPKNDTNRKSWYALIIKRLLLLGADTTSIQTSRYLAHVKIPMQLLAQCASQPHEWILPIFDALKPDLDLNKLTFQEYMVVQAYQEFLEGKHDDLRNQLLVLPCLMQKKGLCRDPFFINLEKLHKVFKSESVKPLLIFLAGKQYQRKIANDILSVIKRSKGSRDPKYNCCCVS